MNVLIIGGGISGISAAKVLLKEGHRVTIVESTEDLGGLMAKIANCRVGFKTFFDEIHDRRNLTIIKGKNIEHVEKNNDGIYKVRIEKEGEIEAEKVIIATGLMPYDPVEIKGKRILTSLEYDSIIDQKKEKMPEDFNKIAFILCVGSRSKEYPLCSSVCCSYTIREIKWTLMRSNPEITVFYNDLRLFGQEFFLERMFRERGVRFIRTNTRYFEEDENGVTIRFYIDGEIKEERFNYAVLAIGLRPNQSLINLSRLFGFSLNNHGFVYETAPLTAVDGKIYICGGAIEPMNIKDSILTGFGAGLLASMGKDKINDFLKHHERYLYKEREPEFIIDKDASSYLFYIGADDTFSSMFYEYASSRFVKIAKELIGLGKKVYVITKNLVVPSYGEIEYELIKEEGVIFINLEEGEYLETKDGKVVITGGKRELSFNVDRMVFMEDLISGHKTKEFLSFYRSEPQLRWSPTKWNRERFHIGFIRHPRAERWEGREIIGALAEILLDKEEERVIPEVNEERCSGCGSCKNACPHNAIEITQVPKDVAIFGLLSNTLNPVAKINSDLCMGCGLCASTCPSDVINLPTAQ
ncbi:MAG TPA: FAD-dependent oxidoreductase [Syntrophorhabdaceae bacterium]|nr:FAD-dependent oxidoreductase [Syntrophorhabdaceae bacterium]